jgi:hypothetical protein
LFIVEKFVKTIQTPNKIPVEKKTMSGIDVRGEVATLTYNGIIEGIVFLFIAIVR